ncbi:hypothetical protein MGH68_06555 [Erysipelothrix sp. D19-032]
MPPSVARSFEALFPTTIVLILFGSITYWLGFNWHTFIAQLVSPLISRNDSYASVMIQTFLNSFFGYLVSTVHQSSETSHVQSGLYC